MITKVIENKSELIKAFVDPNIIHNRFDLLYDINDYELLCIETEIEKTYIPIYIEDKTAKVALYLRKINIETFNLLTKYIFDNYNEFLEIFFLHTYTNIPAVEEKVHWHVDLPDTIEEFDKTLSPKVRYNTKWYPKKIIKDLGEYDFYLYSKEEVSNNILNWYFKWKEKSHEYL